MTALADPAVLVADTPSPSDVRSAMFATYVVFAGSGMFMSSWASRIPQVRDRLHLQPSKLGFVLLALALGAATALPLSGPLTTRLGSRRVVALMAVGFGAGVVGVAVGYRLGVVPVVVGLFLAGFSAGSWDVAMNVHGALVEQHLGRSIMSRFHAGFSFGTVAGALIGAAMVAAKISVTIHLVAVAIVVSSCVVWSTRQFLANHAGRPGDAPTDNSGVGASELLDGETRRGSFASWREPRTILIGVFVLAFAFAEGVGNDWIAVALIDSFKTAEAVGTLAFAVFLAAMTTGRWFGPGLLDRFGRTPVVRTLALLGIAGTLVFVVAPSAWLAFGGAILWGLGASLGFPVGMSAGSDEPALAAGRVSVIASIGYCAFLAGPPLIGFLGDHFTVQRAVATVTVLFALSAVIAPIVQPLAANNGPERIPS
jgi:MFS family permease